MFALAFIPGTFRPVKNRLYSNEIPGLDQPLKMPLDLPRQLSAGDQKSQLYLDAEGILGEIDARQEQTVSIGHATLVVQDADLAFSSLARFSWGQ